MVQVFVWNGAQLEPVSPVSMQCYGFCQSPFFHNQTNFGDFTPGHPQVCGSHAMFAPAPLGSFVDVPAHRGSITFDDTTTNPHALFQDDSMTPTANTTPATSVTAATPSAKSR